MTAPNNLEIKGSLIESPLAKLLVEAGQAHLDGSFRIANNDRKSVIYLRGGEIVFAVANAREYRLFEMLLKGGRMSLEQVKSYPEFANDLEFSRRLIEENLLNPMEAHNFFTEQTRQILAEGLAARSGDWLFSPLARVRDSINYRVQMRKILLEHGRTLSNEYIVRQFSGFQETFGIKPAANILTLLPVESFVMSRFGESFITVNEIISLCGIPEVEVLKALYNLWLGGFLFRQNYKQAFSERRISSLLAAKLRVKRDEPLKPVADVADETPPVAADESAQASAVADEKAQESVPTPEEEAETLEVYLARVEEAVTLYQVLGVKSTADVRAVKNSYFRHAKKYHPDLFHRESGTPLHKRIQTAFTELAHAYEILKDPKTRETYDYRNRKKIDEADNGMARPKPKPAEEKREPAVIAEECFNTGYDYLSEEAWEEALPYLAKAVAMMPEVARYRAFYGKLLSLDEGSRYKAEAEMQQAVKLDPDKPEYRIFLAEFYITYNMPKRAEGELQRLLAGDANNHAAHRLLDSLKNK